MRNVDLKFKYFLLNEDNEYLAGRVGDILNAIQDTQQNAQGMGTKQLVRNAERVVNQIRRILHTNWGTDSLDELKMLQRVGVAIKQAIEDKNDLNEVLGNAANEIQNAIAKAGVPINKVGPKGGTEEESPKDQTAPPQGKQPKSPPQGQGGMEMNPAIGDNGGMGGMDANPPSAIGQM